MIIPAYKQKKKHTCGPAALRMLLAVIGVRKSEESLAKLLKTTKARGTYNTNFENAAKKLGLDSISKKNASLSDLRRLKDYLIILNYIDPEWNVGHYAILRKIDSKYLHVIDPSDGLKKRYLIKDFRKIWRSEFGNFKRWFFAAKK
mgnify:FL=1